MTRKPELLAPAGDWECVRAAVANGADAVYFGLPKFNARLRAHNFTEEDLPALMDYLHARGVKGYIAFNTLIFTSEIEAAEQQLRLLQKCRVDAAIIQDLGLVQLARAVAPDVEVHASTQMTLTSPEGVQFAKRLGVARVVLARELSLRELAKFRGDEFLPTEVFVHGALCVAYSGQCLTSESLGQRSANRGECAQACRLPYELVVDGETRDLGDRRYLLSPQDLAAIEEIPELVKLGVESFKIEGRLKTPEYVAAVTQVYRKAIDAAWNSQNLKLGVNDRYNLEMTFSRGLFSGWMHGVDHQQLVHARFGKKRGPFVGRIARVVREGVELEALPDFPLEPGDGLVFDTGGDTNREQGGRLYEKRGRQLFFQHGKIDFRQLRPGDRIWKTDDPKLEAELRKTFAKDPAPRRQPLEIKVSGRGGEPLILEALGVRVASGVLLQKAEKRPLTEEVLRDQLGRLGETAWDLGSLTLSLEPGLLMPLSELNRMRRLLIERLGVPNEIKPAPISSPTSWRELFPLSSNSVIPNLKPEIVALCRSMEQIDAALEEGVRLLYLDFEDIRRYKDGVARVRAHRGAEVYLATPRIQKAGEQGFFKLIENAEPDGVLVRNLGALDYFRASPLKKVGDFSLNVANPLTAQILKNEGLEKLTISYDLNASQVLDLLRAAPPEWFELTLHQHMPMFHMEHCVFAAFLSEGKDHLTCGRPCDRHQIAVRDRVGMEHPVKADVGCRNTVYHERAQSGARYWEQFRAAGVNRFRIEFLIESGEQAGEILRNYRALLDGKIFPEELSQRLKVADQLGVTSGTLTVLR